MKRAVAALCCFILIQMEGQWCIASDLWVTEKDMLHQVHCNYAQLLSQKKAEYAMWRDNNIVPVFKVMQTHYLNIAAVDGDVAHFQQQMSMVEGALKMPCDNNAYNQLCIRATELYIVLQQSKQTGMVLCQKHEKLLHCYKKTLEQNFNYRCSIQVLEKQMHILSSIKQIFDTASSTPSRLSVTGAYGMVNQKINKELLNIQKSLEDAKKNIQNTEKSLLKMEPYSLTFIRSKRMLEEEKEKIIIYTSLSNVIKHMQVFMHIATLSRSKQNYC